MNCFKMVIIAALIASLSGCAATSGMMYRDEASRLETGRLITLARMADHPDWVKKKKRTCFDDIIVRGTPIRVFHNEAASNMASLLGRHGLTIEEAEDLLTFHTRVKWKCANYNREKKAFPQKQRRAKKLIRDIRDRFGVYAPTIFGPIEAPW